jgi:hypothetical protein
MCEAAVSLRRRMIIARRWERSPVSRKMFIVPPCPNRLHQLLCNKKKIDGWIRSLRDWYLLAKLIRHTFKQCFGSVLFPELYWVRSADMDTGRPKASTKKGKTRNFHA